MIPARRAALALLALVPLVVTACHRERRAPLAGGDRVRVYAAVLQTLKAEQRDSSQRLVVLDTLMAGELLEDQLDYVGARLQVDRALVTAFVDGQRAPTDRFSAAMVPGAGVLAAPFAHLDSLRRLARAEAGKSQNEVFWKQWYAAYPNSSGYVILSPAMVSANGRDALIYVTRSCGALCGTGEVRHLRRDANGQWRIAGTLELWVS